MINRSAMMTRLEFILAWRLFFTLMVAGWLLGASVIYEILVDKAAPEGMAKAGKGKKKGKGKGKKKRCSKKKRRRGRCGNNGGVTPPPPVNPNARVRKSVKDWTPREWEVFKSALQKSNADGEDGYLKFPRKHHEHMDVIHGGPVFPGWHHGFNEEFEDHLRSYESEFECLPLVLWHDETDRAIVLHDDHLGLRDYATTWRVLAFDNASGDLVEREPGLRRGSSGYEWPLLAEIRLVLEAAFFDAAPFNQATRGGFRNTGEGWDGGPLNHNLIHVKIGMDAAASTSPNDPLFWIIHVYLDYLWWLWKRSHMDVPTAGIALDAPMPDFISSTKTFRQMEASLLKDTSYPDNLIQFQPRSARSADVTTEGNGGNNHGGHASHGKPRKKALKVGNRFIPAEFVQDVDGGVMSMQNFPFQVFKNDLELQEQAEKFDEAGIIILAEEENISFFTLPGEVTDIAA